MKQNTPIRDLLRDLILDLDMARPNALGEAETQILAYISDVIGKDEIEIGESVYNEETEQTYEVPDYETQARNDFRAELRKAFGIGDKK